MCINYTMFDGNGIPLRATVKWDQTSAELKVVHRLVSQCGGGTGTRYQPSR